MNKHGLGVGSAMGILAGMVFAAPLTATAANLDSIDAYYVADSTLELKSGGASAESEEGDGFGVKLTLMLGEHVFLSGLYQSTDVEDIGGAGSGVRGSTDDTRIGLGYNTSLPIYAFVEYINYDVEVNGGSLGSASNSETGFGAHVGARFDLATYFTLDARAGYLDIGDADGFEYLAGIGLDLDRNFGLFADYRVVELDGDNDAEQNTQDVRAGFRFRF
ncbi:Outer membrane protein beta-barrel domain-containing protein [Fontimonas thermophila]|uniref:Outer membrane protein beta-barrel domain-containing protein n=1 Tax=Fontimonas thermophila TaxID=1076937 RepID=A0A1I2GYB6_9GAMM|nr:outer membrane beta-barrel protein [Fontimonas thermophila]SFF22412.1 Outer membrane protein beta-barrel domain-containing protein [Fontimonas thermophila]